MIRKAIILFFVCYAIVGFVQIKAQQNRYWVFFKDKQGSTFNPKSYFDAKAIERRIKTGIPLYDSTDFPLNKKYIVEVEKSVNALNGQTRWFNAVSVTATQKQLSHIKAFNFVKSIQPIVLSTEPAGNIFDSTLTSDEFELLELQTAHMQAKLFWDNGLTGKGVRIAVFDAGFPSVDENPVFKHLIENNRIIKTHDFAKKKENVYSHNVHGTMVLSCIAGRIRGKNIGLAPDAEFLLARTEVKTEPFSEEENWLEAVEWADKNGADIINSSLAYTYHRYYTYQMDGHTSLVARAANLAATKGMLVINAMGNDGAQDWKILATPADADSVLSVGAISPYTDFHAAYSSFGPTAVLKTKPNVVAVGTVIASGKSKLKKVKGTSFATPLVTGFAACVLQSKSYLTNMEVFDLIEQSGNLYPYYDYAHGYGVPQASFFINGRSLSDIQPTFEFVKEGDTLTIHINEKIRKKNKQKGNFYLYYNIKDENGILKDYWLIDVYQQKAAVIDLSKISGSKITAHYRGFTNSYDFVP